MSSPLISLDDVDNEFENMPTTIVVKQNIQELSVDGIDVGPIEAGKELEMRYWTACQLVSAGLAVFKEDSLMSFSILYKIHWKETKLQMGRRISSLPEYFYPKLRRYLSRLKEKAATDATRVREYNNALRLSQDIVNCRLKKIVSLSASPVQTGEVLQKLSKEERVLYERLRSIISMWRTKIFKAGADS